ncbi:MAG: PIN domain-containing protein [Anaerolineae bacterium]|nr:PIN domain-containing protein [Anaerolineae bacterium]
MSKILIDTNLLVYAHDARDTTKQTLALAVLGALQANGAGCISTQSLSEFCNTATRGRVPLFSKEIALQQAEVLAQAFQVLPLSVSAVLEAMRGTLRFQMAFYDAQLWAIAKLNQIPTLLSEDFSSGASYDGVRCVNPFAPDFDLDDWV